MSWLDSPRLIPPAPKKESQWKYITCSTSGGGIEFVASSGGTILFEDPNGKPTYFRYLGIGAGLSPSIKIGKFEVDVPASATFGPTDFPSRGKLFVLDNLSKDELSESDIQGPCAILEVGVGFGAGMSGTMMYVGLDPMMLPLLTSPGYSVAFINSAKGLLIMQGLTKGFQIGGTISVLLGYLH